MTHETRRSIATVLVCVVVAWGAITFGAVYIWALLPLLIGAAIVGGLGFIGRSERSWAAALAAAAVCAAVVAQLIPLSQTQIAALSPALRTFLFATDVPYGSGTATSHALSAAPDQTWWALASVAVLGLMIAGLSSSHGFSRRTASIARAVTIIGVVVALLALAQKAAFNGKIFWFWESEGGRPTNYFGPFVNRNHFAGWMVLAGALAAGWFAGQIATTAQRLKPGWRNRVLWLSTPEASSIVLTGCALVLMFVSLVWSMSRSGIASGAVALGILVIAAYRYMPGTLKRVVSVSGLMLALVFAAAWRGTGDLAEWYGKTNTLEWRVALWKDTVPALKDFWITGAGLGSYDRIIQLYPLSDPMSRPEYAHNDYLQLAVEGGLLVSIPVLIVLGFFARAVVKRLKQPQDEIGWWIRMGAVAGICGIAVQEITDFSLRVPGVAVLFAVLVAIAIHEPAPIALKRERHVQKAEVREFPATVA